MCERIKEKSKKGQMYVLILICVEVSVWETKSKDW